jgi:hypothetical protein
VNGEAIYATRSRKPFSEGDKIFYTRSKDNRYVYLIHIGWPYPQLEVMNINPKKGSQIYLLGFSDPVKWHRDGLKTIIEIPPSFNEIIPCEYSYCFKIEQI